MVYKRKWNFKIIVGVKNLLPLLFFLISINSYSQELVKYYYPDSTISAIGSIRDGKPDGYWKNYYPNGILKSIGKRTNFELDSIWNFYDEKGKIQKEISYNLGKKNGYYKEYIVRNDSVYLYSNILYINDLRQGTAVYYKNNKIYKTIPFVDDKMDGQGFEYDEDSIINGVFGYKNNELISKQSINRTDKNNAKTGTWMEFYPNGNIKTEANYAKGKLNGIYKLFDSRQRLLQVGNYESDSLLYSSQSMTDFEEPFEKKEYYADSTLKYKGSYKDQLPIGIHRFYDSKGKVEKSILYDSYGTLLGKGILLENGKKDGFWIQYLPNGVKESEGSFVQDEKSGLWKFYYPSGTIKQEGYYVKDKPSGLWKWYFESGVLQKQEEFAMGKRNGLSIQYDEQGIKVVEGFFLDNKENGEWIITSGDIITKGVYEYGDRAKTWESHYISNGKLQFKGSYFTGKPRGKHEYFYNNGKLEHDEIYKNGKPKKAWSYYNDQGALLYVVYFKKGKEEKVLVAPEKK